MFQDQDPFQPLYWRWRSAQRHGWQPWQRLPRWNREVPRPVIWTQHHSPCLHHAVPCRPRAGTKATWRRCKSCTHDVTHHGRVCESAQARVRQATCTVLLCTTYRKMPKLMNPASCRHNVAAEFRVTTSMPFISGFSRLSARATDVGNHTITYATCRVPESVLSKNKPCHASCRTGYRNTRDSTRNRMSPYVMLAAAARLSRAFRNTANRTAQNTMNPYTIHTQPYKASNRWVVAGSIQHLTTSERR